LRINQKENAKEKKYFLSQKNKKSRGCYRPDKNGREERVNQTQAGKKKKKGTLVGTRWRARKKQRRSRFNF